MGTPVLHVELVDQTRDALELRFWRDNPSEVLIRTLLLAEIDNLVRTAETDYYSPLPARLETVGQQLFRWLDGDERRISGTLESLAHEATVVVLAIATSHRLGHLPWEVLHDGKRFLVHAPSPPVLPVRWLRASPSPLAAQNRPLQVLFMAASPEDTHPVLDFEREEASILDSATRAGLDLTVEESGCLEELGILVSEYPDDFFDVLHLTGHADHDREGSPVFLLEDAMGRAKPAKADEIAAAIAHRPPLVFLSGCRTGQDVAHGEVRSLAEQLLAAGFRAVVGWGKPVLDSEAILVAQRLYRELSSGVALPVALYRTHAALREHPKPVRDWHLLRLFTAGDPPGALVTPLHTKCRRRPVPRTAESEFLDPLTRTVKVATRAGFVGRRRLLQAGVRFLRGKDASRVGLLLTGQGGRGKSSVAARLCDRLRRDLQRIVVIGKLDETSLLRAWAPELPDEPGRKALQDHQRELRFRLEDALTRLADDGLPEPLFVLDDFEQNQPNAEQGNLQLDPAAAAALDGLVQALAHTGRGRLLITGRYSLPPALGWFLHQCNVPPLDGYEQRKQNLRLDRETLDQMRTPSMLMLAQTSADGNPCLYRALRELVWDPGLDPQVVAQLLRAQMEQFRTEIMAQALLASLPERVRRLLGHLLLIESPVPLGTVQVLVPESAESDLRSDLERAASLSLLDITEDEGQRHYRVPRQLAGGEPPLLVTPTESEYIELAGRVCDDLYRRWWVEAEASSEFQRLELIKLAAHGGRAEILTVVAEALTSRWLDHGLGQETADLLEAILGVAGRPHRLLLNLARAKSVIGDSGPAGELLKEAAARCPPELENDLMLLLLQYTDWLEHTGDLQEAERICEERLLPLCAATKDDRYIALARGKIADVLAARGELDEALRIRREELVPVYERLGEDYLRAVTVGKIADVLAARGDLDEALRIRREEELPVYERFGRAHARAMTLGKIADVMVIRGELDEAVRIYNEEGLPVYERLGDLRSRALTLDRLADVLAMRGDVDEALRIRREEELPVYEQLGDVHSKAMTLGKIADVLVIRGEVDEALRIRREEQLPIFKRLGDVRAVALTMGRIADVLVARGDLEGATRIRKDEELPVYERLQDVREQAVTLRKIADIEIAQGRFDKGIELLNEAVALVTPLGAVRDIAVFRGLIADVLEARGELDEALRIRREEEMPVYVRLGDVRSRACVLGKIAGVLAARKELDEALRICREEVLPVFRRLCDAYSLAVTMGKIADLLAVRGELDEAVRIRREDELPVYERLGRARELMAGRIALAALLMGHGRERHLPEILDLARKAHEAAVRCGYQETDDLAELLRCLGHPVSE